MERQFFRYLARWFFCLPKRQPVKPRP